MDRQELVEKYYKSMGNINLRRVSDVFNDNLRGTYVILRAINNSKGIVTAGEIAKQMNISTARVAVALNLLDQKGYIKKEHNLSDARKTNVTMTEKGAEILKEWEQKIYGEIDAFLDRLTEEEALQLLNILNKLGQKTEDGKTMDKHVLDSLKNRRSIRAYKPEQISDEELDAVLEAGTYAPTARGMQSPVIVSVQDKETVALLDKMNAEVIGDTTKHPYYGAPTILLVLGAEDNPFTIYDCTLVAGNLMNAAYAAGLGSCWIFRSEAMFKTEQGKELLRKWGLPEDMRCVSSIALGYADCPDPQPKPRKSDYIIKV